MNKLLSIFFLLSVISCDTNSSQLEKEYVLALEERISNLEKEVSEIKLTNETNKNIDKKQKSENLENYFKIGSTMEEVIQVMGEPTSYLKTAPEAKKLYYDLSTIYFYQNKVISYDNLGKNLLVKVK